MGFINEKNRKVNWFNKNYYFSGTLILILATFICFYTINQDCRVTSTFQFIQLISCSFGHLDLGHIIGNMVTLLFVGLFFERKFGTLTMLISYPLMSILAVTAVLIACDYHFTVRDTAAAIAQGQSYYFNLCGASCVINAYYGLFFMSLVFDFKKIISNKINIIIYLLCFICFTIAMFISLPGLTQWLEITRNVHWPGLLTGVFIGLIYYLIRLTIGQIRCHKNKS